MEKRPPFQGVQSFFDLQSRKKVERVVFIRGPHEDHELLYVALYDTKNLKRVLKMSGLDKKAKDLIK